MGATFGGLVGGVLAERIVALFSVGTLVLTLAVVQLGCAVMSAAVSGLLVILMACVWTMTVCASSCEISVVEARVCS